MSTQIQVPWAQKARGEHPQSFGNVWTKGWNRWPTVEAFVCLFIKLNLAFFVYSVIMGVLTGVLVALLAMFGLSLPAVLGVLLRMLGVH